MRLTNIARTRLRAAFTHAARPWDPGTLRAARMTGRLGLVIALLAAPLAAISTASATSTASAHSAKITCPGHQARVNDGPGGSARQHLATSFATAARSRPTTTARGSLDYECFDLFMGTYDTLAACNSVGQTLQNLDGDVVGWWCTQIYGGPLDGSWQLHIITCRYVNNQDEAETWFNTNSQLALEVYHSSTSSGAAVDQFTWNNTSTQWWLPIRNQDGYYQLVNTNSGMCMDGGSAVPQASIIQWTCNGTYDQQWRFVFTGRYDGGWPVYNLVNHLSGLCLDVPHGSIFAGTVLWQYRCNGTGAQQWY